MTVKMKTVYRLGSRQPVRTLKPLATYLQRPMVLVEHVGGPFDGRKVSVPMGMLSTHDAASA